MWVNQMVKKVENMGELQQFILFSKLLYHNDEHYVLPFFKVLKKELSSLVLKTKTYTAILAYQDNQIQGRLLYTFHQTVCYFSFFDANNNLEVVRELFDQLEKDCRTRQIISIEGTFTPYDPDTRRGILIEGFDIDPTLFTSYNYPYYQQLLESVGLVKKIDTYSLKANVDEATKKKLTTIANYVDKKMDVRIDKLNYRQLDRDLNDIHLILQHATTNQNYQDAPSMEMIRDVAKNLRILLDPNLIIIARESSTNRPIGFCLVLLDYNQLFKKMKGKLQLWRIMFQKHKITKARGMLQYVIPEYQATGVIGSLFHAIFVRLEKIGVTDFEAGTMLEENLKPLNVFDKFGGKIVKTYRIYRKELKL
jgi:hypothetical protein